MDGKTTIINSLRKFKDSLSKDYVIERMIFFGSRASGKPHEDSDIDLIIVSENFRDVKFFKRPVRLYDYWNLKYPVDFLCYTPEEFKKKSRQITVVREAVKEGVTV